MTRTLTRLSVLGFAAALGVVACVETRDRCEGTSCPDDRVCIVLVGGPRCVCADPLVEIDGECVDESGEGEGE